MDGFGGGFAQYGGQQGMGGFGMGGYGGGAGFMAQSPAGSNPSNTSPNGQQREGEGQAVLAVTIHNLRKASQDAQGSVDKMRVHGKPVGQSMFFTVVAKVEQIVPEQNQMAYKINDGTGKIWAKLYVGHGETPAQVEEWQYHRFVGNIRGFGGHDFHLGVHCIRKAELNEYAYHFAETQRIFCKLVLQAGKIGDSTSPAPVKHLDFAGSPVRSAAPNQQPMAPGLGGQQPLGAQSFQPGLPGQPLQPLQPHQQFGAPPLQQANGQSFQPGAPPAGAGGFQQVSQPFQQPVQQVPPQGQAFGGGQLPFNAAVSDSEVQTFFTGSAEGRLREDAYRHFANRISAGDLDVILDRLIQDGHMYGVGDNRFQACT